jgi:hypothetical protein
MLAMAILSLKNHAMTLVMPPMMTAMSMPFWPYMEPTRRKRPIMPSMRRKVLEVLMRRVMGSA